MRAATGSRAAVLALLVTACGGDSPRAGLEAPAWRWRLPAGFDAPPVPADNPMTVAGVQLGRHLFHDTRLSADGSMSCATCHQQALAFTDGRPRAVGVTGEVHPRGAPSLANVAWARVLTWSNPLLTHLEEQVVIPVFSDSPVEMGMAGRQDSLLARLGRDSTYRALFAAAWPADTAPVTLLHLTQALAQFQRTLVSGYSAWDQYEHYGDREAVSASAIRGADLFRSERLGCAACHAGPALTVASTPLADSARPYFNNGLAVHTGGRATPNPNPGLAEFTSDQADLGKFRPPTLRNVAVTAPYMHDGRLPTLEAVIDHYASGGRALPNRDPRIRGFTLSRRERADLLSFLESLTDSTFLQDPAFGDPWGG